VDNLFDRDYTDSGFFYWGKRIICQATGNIDSGMDKRITVLNERKTAAVLFRQKILVRLIPAGPNLY
jgi:hypothetical protein